MKHATEWIVGDPLDPVTKIGPMVEERHMEKVLGYIETGRDEGAKVVIGGGRVLKETGGYFVAPTIFDNVSRDSVSPVKRYSGRSSASSRSRTKKRRLSSPTTPIMG